ILVLMWPPLCRLNAVMFSYSVAFKGLSITLFLSALIVICGVHEVLAKIIRQPEQTSYSTKEVLQHIIGSPVLFIVMLTSSLVQLAHFSVQPILSLYVKELHGPVNIAFFSGLAFSVAGLGNLFLARRWGIIGDKIGYIKVL